MDIYKLVPGTNESEYVSLLLSLTRIRSEALIRAINMVLVNGHTEKMAAAICGIHEKSVFRGIDRLNATYKVVEKIKEYERSQRQ